MKFRLRLAKVEEDGFILAAILVVIVFLGFVLFFAVLGALTR